MSDLDLLIIIAVLIVVLIGVLLYPLWISQSPTARIARGRVRDVPMSLNELGLRIQPYSSQGGLCKFKIIDNATGEVLAETNTRCTLDAIMPIARRFANEQLQKG